MPVKAVSAVERGLTVCPLFGYEILLKMNKDLIYIPPPMSCTPPWREGVTMNDAYVYVQWTLYLKDSFHGNVA
jgi:hypothetical protein